ncbi:MAG: hypothetical protein ACM336_01695 [Acidobacteriota bacterium]
MREMRETERVVKEHLAKLQAPPTDSERQARTLADATAAMREAIAQPAPARRWAARLAAVAVATILIVVIAGRVSRPVWALDQAIAALQKYKACNLTLIDAAGVVYDLWAEAEPSGELSGDMTMKGSNGSAVWVKDNRTYYYDRASNTVEVDDAKTAGFTPWLGPELFRMIAGADDARTTFEQDPATGRDVVVMTGSLLTAGGPVSWSMEFDKETKLPMAFKQWSNPGRSGTPALSGLRITYYKQPPEGSLRVDAPAGATYRPRPIVLPEPVLAMLGGPDQGIPAEGLTREQAARSILGQVYAAAIAGDLGTIRKLCPLTRAWSDELVRSVIVGRENRSLAEVVSIGKVVREGGNRLGPFVVVPSRLKTRDGRIWEDRQIVQFRRSGGRESCAVYGPYGMISEIR